MELDAEAIRRFKRYVRCEERRVRVLAEGFSPRARVELGRAIGFGPAHCMMPRKDREVDSKKTYVDGVDDLIAMAYNGTLERLQLEADVEKEVETALRAMKCRMPPPVHSNSHFAKVRARDFSLCFVQSP